MTLDNMTGITKGSYTGFCKSQLITCNRVKECNGVCPFEDALKHADKMQTINEQHTVDHDRDWIIGCIKHDGFIKTYRFDKANRIILDALQFADRPTEWIPVSERLPENSGCVLVSIAGDIEFGAHDMQNSDWAIWCDSCWNKGKRVDAWMPLPEPYREDGEA